MGGGRGRVGLDSPGRQDGLGPTERPGRQPGPPGATRRAQEGGKSEAGKARRCPRGEAAVLKGLSVQTPEGVLKSGYPGSDGGPGCGFSWLPAWRTRRGPKAPRVPVESQATWLFCRPHLELFFAFVPRKTRERLARASPSPVEHPASSGEPGCGRSRLRAWHPGGGTRLPGSPWRARQYGSFAVRT